LFGEMDKIGILQKLIRLIRMTICQTKERVKTDSQISVSFEFNKGVKCSGRLSSPPFVLHYTMLHRK